jgi:hypothetical protein
VFAHCLYLNHSKNGAKFPSALPIEVFIDLVELSFIFKGTKLILQSGVGGLTSYFLRGDGMDVFWNDPL